MHNVREIKTEMKVFEKIPSKFCLRGKKSNHSLSPVNSRINEVCLKCEFWI